MRFALLAAVLVTALFAADGEYTLAGRVINKQSGEPVGRAAVTVIATGLRVGGRPAAPMVRQVMSDSAGQFRFAGLPEANYIVSAKKPQFENVSEPGSVRLSSSNENFEIRMTPLGVIEGTVTDTDGNPLPDVRIKMLTASIVSGRRRVDEHRSVSTNDRGAYRLWNLRHGKYYVKVAGRGGGTMNFVGERGPIVEIREAYEDVYLGGARSLAAATPIQLMSGQTARADFSIAPQPAFAVRGRLTGFRPDEPANFEIARQGSAETISVRAAYNQSSGRFEINDVPSGAYSIRVHQGEAERALYGEADVRVAGADLADAVIDLGPGVEIHGTTFCPAETGGDPTACLVHPLVIDSENEETTGMMLKQTSESAVSWTIGPLRPGQYAFQASTNGGYISAVTVSGAPYVPGSKLSVVARAPPLNVEVRSARDGGGIDVEAAQKLAPTVAIVAVANSPSFEPPGVCTASPECTFQGLKPGEYSLYAFPSLDDIEYAEPGGLGAFRPVARVSVQAGSTQKVVIEGYSR